MTIDHPTVLRLVQVALFTLYTLLGASKYFANAAGLDVADTQEELQQLAFYDRLARSVGPDGEFPSTSTVLALLAEHGMHLHGRSRQARSLEGAACLTQGLQNNNAQTGGVLIPPAIGTGQFAQPNTPCYDFPLTICSPATAKCICDLSLSVRLPLLPGYTFCIPIKYTINTRRCLPTEPDICGAAFAGSKCVFNADRNEREWRCQCLNGGDLGSCRFFVGMSCYGNTQVCQAGVIGLNQAGALVQPTNSACNSTSQFDSTAACVCVPGTVPTRDLQRCIARQCPPGQGGAVVPLAGNNPLSPCRGPGPANCLSPGLPGFQPNSGSYFCQCTDIGISHSEFSDGICCQFGSIPCADFSNCVQQNAVCDGKKDCLDCSDEAQPYCAKPLLQPDPTCRRFPQTAGFLGPNALFNGFGNGGMGRAAIIAPPAGVTTNSGATTSIVGVPTGKILPLPGTSGSGQSGGTASRILEPSSNATAQQPAQTKTEATKIIISQ